jgi:predicted transposase/invertase (TIGR01784 family)
VFQIAEIAKYNPKDRQSYENSLKYYRDMENSLDLKYEKGLKEGVLQTAKNMISKGFAWADIMEVTGLTEAEIKKL